MLTSNRAEKFSEELQSHNKSIANFSSKDMPIKINHYDELIQSLPEDERDHVIAELESPTIVNRAEVLCSQLASQEPPGIDLKESRTLFLAALRNLKHEKITAAQLASMHILDSAIRTLYTDPFVYLGYEFVADDKIKIFRYILNITSMVNTDIMPQSVRYQKFNEIRIPKDMTASDLPERMQKPLIRRYFNLSDSEWINFCKEMHNALPSEQLLRF